MRIYPLRIFVASLVIASGFVSVEASARSSDVMPPPQKAPRVAVVAQPIKDATPKAPTEYEGRARAIDGERLMVGEKEIRLFGILTPALGSNYGPQAKDKLEQLVQGKDVLCKVTGRDAEARPIAFCGTVNTPDISYEMLRQGWAMLDRKALKNNSLETVYGRVEQEAQTQSKGLFAPMPMTVAIPVTNPSRSIVLPDASAPVALETGTPKKVEPVAPIVAEEKKPETASTQKAAEPKMGEQAPDALVIASVQQGQQNTARGGRSFIERYQQILSSVFLILAAAGFGAVFLVRDRLRLRDRRRMLAAALHGELSALRQICRTRARELARQRRIVDVDNQPRPSQLWPRLRITLFQAQAANLGLLGSDLARQVARIYGQCADYAVMAQGGSAQARLPSAQAVSESLASLADQMENALEALATVENTGEVFVTEQVVDEDYIPEEVVEAPAAPVQAPVNEAEKRMEKAMEVMAGLFRSRREKTASPLAEGAVAESAVAQVEAKADDAVPKSDKQQAA